MNYKSYKDLGNDVHANIHKLQGQGYDLVVGIPRSGMIPAYMIALLLNINCVDLNTFLSNGKVSKGRTRKTSTLLKRAWDARKVLLVDDSLKTGNSMQEAVQAISNHTSPPVTRLAIYVEKVNLNCVDLHFEVLPGPRVYQWNLFHNSLINNACVELEGVLCVPPSEEVLRDERRYRAFLSQARPLILPTYKIHTILTSRPEKYREPTVQWLHQHHIEYQRLEMIETTAPGEREHPYRVTAYKADYYRATPSWLFIEKEEAPARRITTLSGKPVLCLDQGEIIQPDAVAVARHGKKHLARMMLRKCQRRFFLVMPDTAVAIMRKTYRKLFR